MSGILGGIANLAGAISQGQDQQRLSRVQAALQAGQITRQAEQDRIAAAVRDREAQHQTLQDRLNAIKQGPNDQLVDFSNPDTPKPVGPAPIAKPKQNYSQPITGPNGDISVINYDDPTHPIKVPGIQGKVEPMPQGPRDQMQLVQSPGPDGKAVYYRVNLTTGEKTPLDLSAVPKSGSGESADATHQMAGDHYGRAKAASDALDKFGGTVASHGQIGNWIMGHNPFDSDIQNANQAGEEFATMFAPILNKGRSTHIEIEQVKKSYVPLVTDTPEQIRIKSAARADLLKQYSQYAHPSAAAAATSPGQPTASGVDPVLQEFGITPVRKR